MALATASPLVPVVKKLKTVSDHVASFWCNEKYADVHFIFNQGTCTQRIPGHKFVLSMWSDVMQAQLNGSMPEDNPDEIEIKDISIDAFKAFLKVLYTDQLHTSIELAPQIIYCAKKYLVDEVYGKCTALVKDHLQDFTHSTLPLLQNLLAIKEDESSLFEMCLEIIDKHGEEAVQSEEFMVLDQATVALIIHRDGLVAKEETIFRSVIKWSIKECERLGLQVTLDNQRQVSQQLLPCIRFPNLNLNLFSILMGECRILESDICMDVVIAFNDDSLKAGLPFSSKPRLYDSSVAGNQIVLLIGGFVNRSYSNEVRTYDKSNGCVVLDAKMKNGRIEHAAGVNPVTNELIVAGGAGTADSAESCILSITQSTQFNSLPNMKQSRYSCASCVIGDRFYLFGGCSPSGQLLSHCEYFDVSLRQWIAIAGLPCGLSHSSAIAWGAHDLNGSSILLFGGYGGNASSKTVYQYHVKDNRWQVRRDWEMVQGMAAPGVVRLGNKIILCGGDTIGNYSSSKFCYSLDTDSGVWDESFPPLNVARCHHQAVVVNGHIMVIGGYASDGNALTSVEMFTGTEWIFVKELDKPFAFGSAVVKM